MDRLASLRGDALYVRDKRGDRSAVRNKTTFGVRSPALPLDTTKPRVPPGALFVWVTARYLIEGGGPMDGVMLT